MFFVFNPQEKHRRLGELMRMNVRSSVQLLATLAIGAFLVTGSEAQAGAVLFTAGVDITFTANPVSIPPQGNPHIPSVDPGVTLTPVPPIPLDGVATGPLNGITYGPGAFPNDTSTGGTTGWVNSTYTIVASDLGNSLFIEVANVGDQAFQSGLAVDNIRINGILVESFEGGIPGGWTTNGVLFTSGPVANLAPTDGSSFLFMDTTGAAVAAFDTVDGTNASNLFAPLAFVVGDVLSFDIAFMTTDGTDTFHDYGLAALGIPTVVGVAVPEPATFALFGAGLAGLGAMRRRRKAKA